MCWCDALEDMRDALDGAYQRGEIGHGLLVRLLDLVDKAERECERLEERVRVDRYTHAHMGGENYDLRTKNAKLRELVRDMSIPYKYGDCDCGLCPHTDQCWDSETLDFSPDGCVILQMVRELGIEVDG